MTDTVKPTPGPWQALRNPDNSALAIVTKDDWYIGQMPLNSMSGVPERERLANAAFIIEASEVYSEANLTPGQLLKRVRELENALDAALNWLVRPISSHIDHEDPEDNDPIYQQVVDVMRAALAKHGEGV